MLMLYLLLELWSILVETFGRVPQSQEATVGRPLKRAQGGCLLPHFRRTPFGGWYNHFQVDSGGSSWLQAHPFVGVNYPCVYPQWSRLLTTRCVDPLTLGWPGSHGVERCAPPAAPGACGGPCFCMVFAFLAWPCTGRPKHTSGPFSQ